MIHLANAAINLNISDEHLKKYVSIGDNKVGFTIQDGPIGNAGVNGIQVTDMLEYVKEVYVSLNKAFPCRENSLTITKIEEAIHWQDARTKDRENRKVEGKNEL